MKTEYDSCIDDVSRSRVMMGIYYSGADGGEYCGYDLTQIQNVMTARARLMTSLFNTSGSGLVMLADDGPLGRLLSDIFSRQRQSVSRKI